MSIPTIYEQFVNYLRETQPIPADIEFTCTFHDVELIDGASGWFNGHLTNRTAHIDVATANGDELNTLRTIGHEYFHVLQSFVFDEFLDKNDDLLAFAKKQLVYECRAEGYGQRFVKEFYAWQAGGPLSELVLRRAA